MDSAENVRKHCSERPLEGRREGGRGGERQRAKTASRGETEAKPKSLTIMFFYYWLTFLLYIPQNLCNLLLFRNVWLPI